MYWLFGRIPILVMILVVSLAPAASLWAPSPAEAQAKGSSLPQFDWNANQAAKQADANARAWEGVKQAKDLYSKGKLIYDIYKKGPEEVAKDLAKKEWKKRSALPEYEEILNETNKTAFGTERGKRGVLDIFGGVQRDLFGCSAGMLMGAEKCDNKDRNGKDTKRNDRDENKGPTWRCDPGLTGVANPDHPSGFSCCAPGGGGCEPPERVRR